jgi:hypothetical protein
MDATTIVVDYAAFVATGSVAIQLAGLRGARTRLRLEASHGATIESQDRDTYGNPETVSGGVLFIENDGSAHPPVRSRRPDRRRNNA